VRNMARFHVMLVAAFPSSTLHSQIHRFLDGDVVPLQCPITTTTSSGSLLVSARLGTLLPALCPQPFHFSCIICRSKSAKSYGFVGWGLGPVGRTSESELR
jgi:hypothetical protein